MSETWGYHLIMDVKECNKEKILDQDYLKAWVKDLVLEIDMIAYGEPTVIHFGKDDPKLAGNTVLQFIETSNILVHFCDEYGDAFVDIFSCKEFNPNVAKKHFIDWFSPVDMKTTFLERKISR